MMIKLLPLVLAIVLCLTIFAACGQQAAAPADTKSADSVSKQEAPKQDTAKQDSGKKLKFGFTCVTMNNPFFISLEKAVRDEVEKSNGTLITLDPQSDQNKQIAQVEDLISQKVDLIFLNPVDWKGVKPALDAAKKAGLPVVNFDAPVFEQDLVNTVVASDNFNAGKICAEDLLKKMPDGGKIAIIDCSTAKSVEDRIDGFMAGLGDKKYKFEVVARQDGKGQLEASMPIAVAMLQANPDIKAFMGGNDPTALGVIAAIKTANKKDIYVYGVDGSPDIKAAIKAGDVTGTGAQSPINIGKESYKAAVKILNKEQVDKSISVKTMLINKDNVDQYGTDKWQ